MLEKSEKNDVEKLIVKSSASIFVPTLSNIIGDLKRENVIKHNIVERHCCYIKETKRLVSTISVTGEKGRQREMNAQEEGWWQ